MPTENDGVIEIPILNEVNEMSAPVDMPTNVAAQVLAHSMNGVQFALEEGRNSAVSANALLRYSAARRFDETGIGESRAESGLIATPVASPATQTG